MAPGGRAQTRVGDVDHMYGADVLAYGFVDASGEGFGGDLHFPDKEAPGGQRIQSARMGFWCDAISEQSSNYRELWNLVEHVEVQANAGLLAGREVWMYTDNQVTESAWFNGTSSNRQLYNLVLRLRHCELKGIFIL